MAEKRMEQIKIGISGARTDIEINGTSIPNVRKYTLEHEGGKAPTLTLEFTGIDISVNGDGFVHCSPEVTSFVKSLSFGV